MTIPVVAFCGSKGAGKGTASSELKRKLEESGIEVVDMAIAELLKNSASDVFDVDMKYFVEPELKEVELDTIINLKPHQINSMFEHFGVINVDFDKYVRPHVGKMLYTPRELLQYVGTEVLLAYDNEIMIRGSIINSNAKAVRLINDMRFLHELKYLSNNAEQFIGICVRNRKAEAIGSGDEHASEQGWRDLAKKCASLDNNGTVHDLNINMDNLSETIRSYVNG